MHNIDTQSSTRMQSKLYLLSMMLHLLSKMWAKIIIDHMEHAIDLFFNNLHHPLNPSYTHFRHYNHSKNWS